MKIASRKGRKGRKGKGELSVLPLPNFDGPISTFQPLPFGFFPAFASSRPLREGLSHFFL